MNRNLYLKTIQICLYLSLLGTIPSFSQSADLVSVIAEPNKTIAPPLLPDYFFAKFEDCSYKIWINGQVTKFFNDNHDSISFKLDVYKGFEIEKAEVSHYKNSLLISFTETNSDEAGSTISEFNLTTLKKDWTFSGLGFSLSKITIRNDFIYVSSIGRIAKINFHTGQAAFKFFDLYDREKNAFSSFSDLVFNGDSVIFMSRNYFSKRLDKVIVNDRTNELIAVDK